MVYAAGIYFILMGLAFIAGGLYSFMGKRPSALQDSGLGLLLMAAGGWIVGWSGMYLYKLMSQS